MEPMKSETGNTSTLEKPVTAGQEAPIEPTPTPAWGSNPQNYPYGPGGYPYSYQPGYYQPGPPPYGRYQDPRRGVRLLIRLFIALLVVSIILGVLSVMAWTWSTTGSPITFGPREIRTESQTVQLGQAQAVNVNLQMGVGNLKLAGGASDLMYANFTYDLPSWRPEVNYQVSGTTGQLIVSQPATQGFNFNSPRYEWDLRLKNDLPVDLNVKTGVGNANLSLQGLDLTSLTVNSGVGNTTVDLTGSRTHNLNVVINAGTGNTTLILPKDVGARIQTNSGLGKVNASNLKVSGQTYTNDAYGKSAVTIEIQLKAGIGNITLTQP